MDSRIYVSEEKMWAAKGRFSQAILDDDPIAWDVSREGKYTLSLLAVSICSLLLLSIVDQFLG
jgi:hypothetical protein